MTVSDPVRTAVPGLSATTQPFRWIESAPFDLAFFVLAPLTGIGLSLAAPTGHGALMLAIGSVLGIPHYLSTFTFYFWDDTRDYRRRHWVEFVAAPLGLIFAFTALMLTGQQPLLMFVVYWWNAFHISRQSSGILSIYRHATRVSAAIDKHLANVTLLAANGCFALWNIEENPTVYPYLTATWRQLPTVLWLLCTAVALIAGGGLIRSLLVRRETGRGASLPEMMFLCGSILLFAPYLWVHDWNRAGFAVLTGHFVQYLGIVWLLHRRKLRGAEGSRGQRALTLLSQDIRLLVLTMLAVALLFMFIPRLSRLIPWRDFYAWFTGIIVFLHFYLDGLFWAFKRPEVRKSMAPYLAARGASAH